MATRSKASAAQPSTAPSRVAVLCAEQRWEEALVLAHPPVAGHHFDEHSLHRLARGLGPAQHEARLALMQRVVTSALRAASSPYTRGLALIGETLDLMGGTQRLDWLAELRQTHKAKRNFIAGLPVA